LAAEKKKMENRKEKIKKEKKLKNNDLDI